MPNIIFSELNVDLYSLTLLPYQTKYIQVTNTGSCPIYVYCETIDDNISCSPSSYSNAVELQVGQTYDMPVTAEISPSSENTTQMIVVGYHNNTCNGSPIGLVLVFVPIHINSSESISFNICPNPVCLQLHKM